MIPMTLCVDGEEKTYEGTMCGKRHTPNFPTNPLVKPLLKPIVNGENALMTTDCVEVAPCGAVAIVCEASVCNSKTAPCVDAIICEATICNAAIPCE